MSAKFEKKILDEINIRRQRIPMHDNFIDMKERKRSDFPGISGDDSVEHFTNFLAGFGVEEGDFAGRGSARLRDGYKKFIACGEPEGDDYAFAYGVSESDLLSAEQKKEIIRRVYLQRKIEEIFEDLEDFEDSNFPYIAGLGVDLKNTKCIKKIAKIPLEVDGSFAVDYFVKGLIDSEK